MSLSRRLPNRGTRFADLLPNPIGRLLDAALDRLEKVSQGLPQLHASTHLQGGSDPFPTPAAPPTIDPNLAASAGTATNYARSDVRPAIDLKLITKGDSLTRDGSGYARESVGADGTVLTADSTAGTGRKWAAPVAAPDVLALAASLPRAPRVPQIQAGANVTLAYNAAGVVISASGGGAGTPDDASTIIAGQVFGG